MKLISFPTLVVFLSCVFTLLLALASHAQDNACPNHPACQSPIVVGGSCQVYLEGQNGRQYLSLSDIDNDLGWRPRTLSPGCFREGQAYALQGFRFNTRGGHKVKSVGVWYGFNRIYGGGYVNFNLGDKDPQGDLADGFVWYTPLMPGSREREASTICRGECVVTIERFRTDLEIVLAGFWFQRLDDQGHVRRVMVMPVDAGSSTRGGYRVAFQDDDFAYHVRLFYVLVPADTLSNTREVHKIYNRGGNFSDEERSARGFVHPNLHVPGNPGWNILRGFEFNFLNGGHFIEDIGIEKTQEGFNAWFQDNQSENDRRVPDDPFEWRVVFSTFTPR